MAKEKEQLPDITHLQFLVLTAVRGGDASGRELRGYLAERGVRRSGPGFYQLMGRLEDAGLLSGRYERTEGPTRPVKERRYQITPAGTRMWERTREIYAGALEDAGIAGRPNA